MNTDLNKKNLDLNKKKIVISIIIIFILVLLMICIGYYLYKYKYQKDVVKHVSSIDGRMYNIRKEPLKNIDSEEESKNIAADYLAILNMKITSLVNYMYENKLPNIEVSQRLADRWRHCILRETNSDETSVAYTVNKGEEMRVCIRKDNKLENMNTSIFVILHELAHIMSVSYGHNEEFRENFSYIVHLASKIGIYEPEDFSNEPVDYCGTKINTTPCVNGSCSIR